MADRYWVDGGNSNFASTTNWSLESGGASGASVPGAGDTAIFDANSGEWGYCEITSTVLCHLNTEAMPEGFEIDIGTDGNLSLQEEQTFYWLLVYSNGILTTNNFNITIRDYIDFREYAVANLGTSIITINCESGEGGLYVTEDVTFDADEATIIINDSLSSLENQCFIAVYNQVIADLQINFIGGACIQFDGNNTFYSLSITGDGLLWFVDWGAEGTIETVINTLELEGDTPGGLLLGSEPPYLWAFVKTTGEVNAVNCTIMNSIARGGAVFNAFTTNGNIDGENNTGWIFEAPDPYSPEEAVELIDEATYDLDMAQPTINELLLLMASQELIWEFSDHSAYEDEVLESLVAEDIEADVYGTTPSINENLYLEDAQNLAWLDSVLEICNLIGEVYPKYIWSRELIETLFVYDQTRNAWAVTAESSLVLADAIETILGIIVDEWINIIDIQSNNWDGREIISENVTLYDIAGFAKIYADTLSDEINIVDVSTYKLTLKVLEYLWFTELANAMRTSVFAASDSLNLADSSALAFPQSVESILDVVDLSTVAVQFLHSVQSSLGLADVSSLIKRFTDTVSDPLIFVDSVSSRASLYSLIYDTLRLNVLVDLEGEFYECYVLNSPQFHASMYSGYNFNSFCVFENRAFGANDEGIYELTGTTDAGSHIHTGVILSKTDFGLPNKKRFRSGYLGISGTNPVMIMETESGERQVYTITSGKMIASHDLKSRSWKLAVAEFDEIDSLELIPVILTK